MICLTLKPCEPFVQFKPGSSYVAAAVLAVPANTSAPPELASKLEYEGKSDNVSVGPIDGIVPLWRRMAMTGSTELSIRLRRAAFNRALAEADLAAIGPVLAPTAVLVAGTDSAVITGRKAQLQAWKREFAAHPRLVYLRLPDAIVTSPIEPIALEHGKWQGSSNVSGEVLASGDYSAKWRKVGEDWVIEAEIFLTLA